MSDERPGPEDPKDRQDDRPEQGAGLEARRASDADAPFPGLRSASDIFGAPRRAEDWPTRRERREAEKAAQDSGEVPPAPFVPSPASAGSPDPGVPDPGAPGAPTPPEPVLPGPATPGPVPPAPATPPMPPQPPSYDDDATQAVSMPEELAAPPGRTGATRSTVGSTPDGTMPPAVAVPPTVVPPAAPVPRADAVPPAIPVPPAAVVPPTGTAPDPRSIQLPTARSSRDVRADEARRIDDERRRVDPDGVGRDDVDWLGRATGPGPVATGPTPSRTLVPGTTGVPGALPPSDEPPAFTDLLRLSDDAGASAATSRPFDWNRQDDTDAVPVTPDDRAVDTTSVAVGSWSIGGDADADADEDDVVAGEQSAAATTALPLPGGPVGAGGVDTGVPTMAWSLADEPDEPDEQTPPTSHDVPATRAEPAPTEALLLEDLPAGAAAPDGQDTPAAPWWAEPDTTLPPTAAPPLVDPPVAGHDEYPGGHLPPAVGQDLDALIGVRADETDRPAADAPFDWGVPARADRPVDPAHTHEHEDADADEVDQSEWDGRETSDTSAIKDLFGTAAIQHVRAPRPDDTADGGRGADGDAATRMMPAVGRPQDQRRPDGFPHVAGPGPRGGGPARPAGRAAPGAEDRDNFINEGFARLQGQGTRGKQLLIGGSIVLIVLMIVAVFVLTRWLLGNDIQEQQVTPTKSPAAAASTVPRGSSAPTAAVSAPTIAFATTPASVGTHSWRQLAGGECISPFTTGWSDTFTVVDCTAAHQGQLTVRKTIDAQTFPGAAALKAQVGTECQSSAALDTAAAAAYPDVQVQGTYPPDQSSWDQGDRSWSCFVSRSGGGALTGSLAPTA